MENAVSINEPTEIEAVTEQSEAIPQIKKSKDFTSEEQDRILKRVEKVGMSQAAREFKVKTEIATALVDPLVTAQGTAILDPFNLKLRVENARLKEQLTALTQEIERLSGAISALATY